MTDGSFMNKLRSFLGLRPELPRNDFRNPIWGSDDEDDGDELYTKQQMDVYTETLDLHQEFTRQMQEFVKSFGNMFGDMKTFFHEDHFDSFMSSAITEPPLEGDTFTHNNGSIRDYYLKPGYRSRKEEPKQDVDLDGKISSHDISGLLKKKDDHSSGSAVPFNGTMVPGRSFCQTIITTSVTKPDGTVETRRIVKNGKDVIEDTTTTGTDSRGPLFPGADPSMGTGFIYNNVMSELSSLFRNFY